MAALTIMFFFNDFQMSTNNNKKQNEKSSGKLAVYLLFLHSIPISMARDFVWFGSPLNSCWPFAWGYLQSLYHCWQKLDATVCRGRVLTSIHMGWHHNAMIDLIKAIIISKLTFCVTGNILPPDNYKHYAHRFVPVASPPPTPPPPGQKTDMFGQRYTPRSQPHLWKLSYKLNHPEYRRLQEEVTKRRKMAEERQKHQYSRVLPSPVSLEGLHGDR